jgi:hypothetical protein
MAFWPTLTYVQPESGQSPCLMRARWTGKLRTRPVIGGQDPGLDYLG